MIELLLALAMIPLALPALSLLTLTLAALGQSGKGLVMLDPPDVSPPRVAVLVPAHNESVNVLATIECLKRQLGSADRLLVIADNCNDDTAELARLAGALVIERHNFDLRGKGYALAFGVDHLRADPPEVVLVVCGSRYATAGAEAAAAGAPHARPRFGVGCCCRHAGAVSGDSRRSVFCVDRVVGLKSGCQAVNARSVLQPTAK